MVELRLSEMEGGKSHDKDLDDVKATELRLALPGTEKSAVMTPRGSKRPLPEGNEERQSMTSFSEEDPLENGRELAPIAKAQVVGWPPIRTFRKNRFQARQAEADAAGIYVKVSMDGAPYLRKIDLEVYKGYKELRESLEDMFKCFSLGALCGMERNSGSEYAITYEDKDGDWMLVGDVPWEMFASSCKRLRIMRGSEARGLGSSP